MNDLLPLSPDERKSFLVAFFKTYYSSLPHYDENSPACEVVDCLATDWLHDEYAGHGSYSCFPVGIERADQDIQTLRKGLSGQHTWFAGEHTAPFDALGTVSGAYRSGEAVGQRIAAVHGRRMNMDI